MDLTEGAKTPEIFRRWSAISCLAGVMERRIWARFNERTLYPNLYVLLVGPPGVGKGMAMGPAEDLWRAVEGVHLIPSSASKAGLMDRLNAAKRHVMVPKEGPIEYNAMVAAARELGHLLPQYDTEMMAAITDLWDCKPYEEWKRGNDLRIKVDKPWVHILGGTTPSYMLTNFPEAAWEQGFASRAIVVFSAEVVQTDPFADRGEGANQAIEASLAHDLRIVSTAYGKMEWDEDTVGAFREWINTGPEHKPTHPKLSGYLSRREVHLAKLCMVASMSRAETDYRITIADYQCALDWLLEAEHYMPDLFKAATGGDSKAQDETYTYIWGIYQKTKKPVHQSEIVAFLRARVFSHSIMKVIEMMEASNLIAKEGMDARGVPFYKPVPRVAHI